MLLLTQNPLMVPAVESQEVVGQHAPACVHGSVPFPDDAPVHIPFESTCPLQHHSECPVAPYPLGLQHFPLTQLGKSVLQFALDVHVTWPEVVVEVVLVVVIACCETQQ